MPLHGGNYNFQLFFFQSRMAYVTSCGTSIFVVASIAQNHVHYIPTKLSRIRQIVPPLHSSVLTVWTVRIYSGTGEVIRASCTCAFGCGCTRLSIDMKIFISVYPPLWMLGTPTAKWTQENECHHIVVTLKTEFGENTLAWQWNTMSVFCNMCRDWFCPHKELPWSGLSVVTHPKSIFFVHLVFISRFSIQKSYEAKSGMKHLGLKLFWNILFIVMQL